MDKIAKIDGRIWDDDLELVIERVRAYLLTHPMARESEIKRGVEGDPLDKGFALREGLKKGTFERQGKGGKGDIFRYRSVSDN